MEADGQGADRRWFVRREVGEIGPLTTAQLKALVAKGTVVATTPVRLDGKDWVKAGRVKGLIPTVAKGRLLLLTDDGHRQVTPARLEQLLDQERIPFDKPVVSVDGGRSWLRPAEALMAQAQGIVVQGFGDPTAFDAFADRKVAALTKDVVGVSAQQLNTGLRAWQGLGLLLILTFFLPCWIDMHHAWFPWNIAEAGDGGLAPVGLLLMITLVLGLAIFSVIRWVGGWGRGAILAGLGGGALVVAAIALFLVDHAASDLLAGWLPPLLGGLGVAVTLQLSALHLRALFPGEASVRVASAIVGILALALAVAVGVVLLRQGWGMLAPAGARPLFLSVTGALVCLLLLAMAAAGVLAGVEVFLRGGDAGLRAAIGQRWLSRTLILFVCWLAIIPVWWYGSTLADSQPMSFNTWLWCQLGTLRAILVLGGAAFLLGSGLVDAVGAILHHRDAARKAAALAEAKQGHLAADAGSEATEAAAGPAREAPRRRRGTGRQGRGRSRRRE